MKFRGLLAAVVILLILGGVLYWSEHRKPSPAAASSPSTPAIVKVDAADVTSLTVTQKGEPPVTLVRSSPGQWQITAPLQARADASAVSGILSTLAPLTAERVVEDKATDLSQFGLADPSVRLNIVGKNNKTTQLSIGDTTPTGNAIYVAVAGDPRVFTVASWSKSSLDKSLNDLRDKRLVPVDAGSVSHIELIHGHQDIDFGRVQNGWQIEKPQTYRTDTFQVDDLLQQITGAHWDPSVTPQDAAKAFAKATPYATVKLTGGNGSDTLDVRKAQDNYYAKSSVLGGTYKVDTSVSGGLSEALNRGLDDFRNKQLFSFGYTDPDKIEVHSGATNLFLTHSGNAWWSNGKKMDTDSVESLATALRDLAATTFVNTGFSNPEIEIVVTSKNGKQVEQAQLQKTSDGAIAKRSGGPSLYSLDGPTMEELTSAIKGIKPAAPAKK